MLKQWPTILHVYGQRVANSSMGQPVELNTKDLHVAFAKLIKFLYCSQRVLISIMWRLWELGQQVPPVAII